MEGVVPGGRFEAVRDQTALKFHNDAEALVRVVFDELGLKEQHEPRPHGIEGAHRSMQVFRYVSDWRPVEQGDKDA